MCNQRELKKYLEFLLRLHTQCRKLTLDGGSGAVSLPGIPGCFFSLWEEVLSGRAGASWLMSRMWKRPHSDQVFRSTGLGVSSAQVQIPTLPLTVSAHSSSFSPWQMDLSDATPSSILWGLIHEHTVICSHSWELSTSSEFENRTRKISLLKAKMDTN